MGERRITVGIRARHHAELIALGRKTNHGISALIDRAVQNFLEDEAPIWSQAAEDAARRKHRGVSDKVS